MCKMCRLPLIQDAGKYLFLLDGYTTWHFANTLQYGFIY